MGGQGCLCFDYLSQVKLFLDNEILTFNVNIVSVFNMSVMFLYGYTKILTTSRNQLRSGIFGSTFLRKDIMIRDIFVLAFLCGIKENSQTNPGIESRAMFAL